jgi:hypothetical protein
MLMLASFDVIHHFLSATFNWVNLPENQKAPSEW